MLCILISANAMLPTHQRPRLRALSASEISCSHRDSMLPSVLTGQQSHEFCQRYLEAWNVLHTHSNSSLTHSMGLLMNQCLSKGCCPLKTACNVSTTAYLSARHHKSVCTFCTRSSLFFGRGAVRPKLLKWPANAFTAE